MSAQCLSISCTPITPTVQAVVPGGGAVTWEWSIEAASPADAQIYVVVTTYEEDTSTPLYVNAPKLINVKVQGTATYTLGRVGVWVEAVLGFVGFGGLVALATWFKKRWQKRRLARSGGEAEQPETEQAEPAGGQAAEVPETPGRTQINVAGISLHDHAIALGNNVDVTIYPPPEGGDQRSPT